MVPPHQGTAPRLCEVHPGAPGSKIFFPAKIGQPDTRVELTAGLTTVVGSLPTALTLGGIVGDSARLGEFTARLFFALSRRCLVAKNHLLPNSQAL